MYKLSVIVPVYNGTEYIKRCFDSILAQQYTNIEVICVNDGSTDNSLEICDEYARHDKRFFVFNKERGGVASARKYGLQYATGDYITFVDSDDWLEPDMYGVMMERAAEDVDMIVCNFFKDYHDTVNCVINREEILSASLDSTDIIRYAFQREDYRGFAAYLWNKIFSKRVIDEMDKSFYKLNLQRGDDVAFLTAAALKSQKAYYIDKCLYHYMQRETSITHKTSVGNLELQQDILRGYDYAIQLLESQCVEAEIVIWLKRFHCYHASLLAEKAMELGEERKLLYYQLFIRKYLEEYINTNSDSVERIQRIRYLLTYKV